MLKSEMQQKFWVTKKTVQRKLGRQEDEHVLSSDAELDAELEVFKSISETTAELNKIIEQYQERLCVLSQEENIFGRFLKEAGKRSKTTGKSVTSTGKSFSFCGQQRMCVRLPLLRLKHEVDIFRNRAIYDTDSTITAMEKERTAYRAAIEWMKSSSSELDPDDPRGVDKFRTAQSHVRAAKQNFDTLSMDSIQKIDLLAAARCNMFSHALVSYMTELKQFAQKTTETFDTISKALDQSPKYDFCVLKELTQQEGLNYGDNPNLPCFDRDQKLFFATDYVDVANEEKNNTVEIIKTQEEASNNTQFIELCQNDDAHMMDLCTAEIAHIDSCVDKDNAMATDKSAKSKEFQSNPISNMSALMTTKRNGNAFRSSAAQKQKTHSIKSLKQKSWIELFSDLDPLANLEAIDMNIGAGCKSSQET